MLLISSKHAAEYTVVFNCVPHVPQAVLIFISTAAAHMNDSGKPRGSEATPSYFASFTTRKGGHCLDCSQEAGVDMESFVDFSGHHFYFFCLQIPYHTSKSHDCTWQGYKADPTTLEFNNVAR